MHHKYIRYFKYPLYGVSGFTAYLIPNSLIHLPVILMVPYIGIFLCGAETKALLTIYFVVALYMGRDLALMSYRNYFIPIGVWALFTPFLIYKKEIADFLRLHSENYSFPLSIGVSCAFILYIILYAKYIINRRDSL